MLSENAFCLWLKHEKMVDVHEAKCVIRLHFMFYWHCWQSMLIKYCYWHADRCIAKAELIVVSMLVILRHSTFTTRIMFYHFLCILIGYIWIIDCWMNVPVKIENDLIDVDEIVWTIFIHQLYFVISKIKSFIFPFL